MVSDPFEVEVPEARKVMEDVPAVAGAQAVLARNGVSVEAQLEERAGSNMNDTMRSAFEL